MKLSKLLSLGLVVSTLITSLTLSASAITPSHQAPVVYSPEFPDAYIVTEVTPETQNLDGTSGSLGSVSARSSSCFLGNRYIVKIKKIFFANSFYFIFRKKTTISDS